MKRQGQPVAPSSSAQRIQEAQTTMYHVLWELTQRALAALRQVQTTAGRQNGQGG